MTLTGQVPVPGGKRPSGTLSTTDTTQPILGLNLSLLN
jgi:hypothetical protein